MNSERHANFQHFKRYAFILIGFSKIEVREYRGHPNWGAVFVELFANELVDHQPENEGERNFQQEGQKRVGLGPFQPYRFKIIILINVNGQFRIW